MADDPQINAPVNATSTPTSNTTTSPKDGDVPGASDEEKPPPYPTEEEIIMSFGSGPNYVFKLGTQWTYAYSKDSPLTMLLRNREGGPRCVSLAPNGSYIASSTDTGGNNVGTWTFANSPTSCPTIGSSRKRLWHETHDAYERLEKWIASIQSQDWRLLHNLVVTFGPSGRYYAHIPDGQSISHNLPRDLTQKLKEKEKGDCKPRIVTFGDKDNWVVIWTDGSLSWNLSKDCKKLDQTLQGCATGEIAYIALNPCDETSYFVAFSKSTDRFFEYSLAFSTSSLEFFEALITSNLQQYARKSKRSFTYMYKRGSANTYKLFTPDSKHDAEFTSKVKNS